ncbi:phage tail protein, partial [Escherichia coli]
NQFVKPLLPLHIVFDGLMLYLSIMIYEREDILEYSTVVASAATFFWFEANELAEIQGVTEESDAIAIAAGGIVVAGIHTFDRTRADDLLLDNDN